MSDVISKRVTETAAAATDGIAASAAITPIAAQAILQTGPSRALETSGPSDAPDGPPTVAARGAGSASRAQYWGDSLAKFDVENRRTPSRRATRLPRDLTAKRASW